MDYKKAVGVSVIEYSYLDGVTSPIQAQLNSKASSFTGYTGTVSVRKGDNSGALTLTYSNGILTGVA